MLDGSDSFIAERRASKVTAGSSRYIFSSIKMAKSSPHIPETIDYKEIRERKKMMSPDGGGEDFTMHFATSKRGDCGPCGVNVDLDKEYTRGNFEKSYPNQSKKWYLEVYEIVANAHKNMKELFRPPTEHAKELEWPWFYKVNK